MTHLVAGLAAYVIEPLKISAIKLLTANKGILLLVGFSSIQAGQGRRAKKIDLKSCGF